MAERVVLGIMPYLKTSEPVRVRGIWVNPSQNIDEDRRLCDECRKGLKQLFPMFYLQHGAPVDRMLYVSAHVTDTDAGRTSLRRMREARILIGYLYTSPHFPGGDPFLRYEHADMYLFSPAEVSRFLLGHPCEDGRERDSEEAPGLSGDIQGFEGMLNQHTSVWAAAGSRLFPPVPHFWVNAYQDLSNDLAMLERENTSWPLAHFMKTDRPLHEEAETRLFTSLEWYNRACSGRITEDVALVHLATAFESLLGLEQGTELTVRFRESILSLMGRSDSLDSWIEQFYQARSKILHTGNWPHLAYYAADAKAYREILKGRHEGVIYRSLSAYGRRLFRLCLTTTLHGTIAAEKAKLHALFIHNQERLETICRVLSDASVDPRKRLEQVTRDVECLDDYWLDSSSLTTVQAVLGAGRLLVRTYLECQDEMPPAVRAALEAILDTDCEHSESEHLREFEQLAHTLRYWRERAGPRDFGHPFGLSGVVQAYADYAAMPDFRLRAAGFGR